MLLKAERVTFFEIEVHIQVCVCTHTPARTKFSTTRVHVYTAVYTAVVFYKFSTILEILIYNKRYWGMEIDPQSC